MRASNSLVLLALVFSALACTPAPLRRTKGPGKAPGTRGRKPAAPSEPIGDEKIAPLVLTAPRIEAFRRYIYAYYDFQIFEETWKQRRKTEYDALKAAEQKARKSLAQVMEEPENKPVSALLKRFIAAVEGTPGLIIVPDLVADKVSSVHLVRAPAPLKRSVSLFGREVGFETVLFNKVEVYDYRAYRAVKLKQPVPFESVKIVGSRFYIHKEAVAELGRRGFWEREKHYAQVKERGRKAASFLEQADEPSVLLTLAKDYLRARSLEQLRLSHRSRPAAKRGEAFVEDYVSRVELRAAAEAYEQANFKKARGRLPKTAKELRHVAELSFYNGMIHGDPRGVLATVFGLARQQLSLKKQISPQHVAALAITVALKNVKINEIPVDERAGSEAGRDAQALFRLANDPPDKLVRYARLKYKERLAGRPQ